MSYKLPLGEWVAGAVDWLEVNDHGLFDKIGGIIDTTTAGIENGLLAIPFWLFSIVFIGIGFGDVAGNLHYSVLHHYYS